MSLVDLTTVLKDAPVGEWLALLRDNSEVVGTGGTPKEAIEAARARGVENPIVLKVPPASSLILRHCGNSFPEALVGRPELD